MTRQLVLAVVLGATACDAGEQREMTVSAAHHEKATSAVRPATQARVARWDASTCGDDAYRNARMDRHPALMGRSPEILAASFGAPSAREDFRVGEPVGTFYGALGRRQPPPPNAGAPARQWTWTRNGCNFSVFFLQRGGRWSAVDAFEWPVGADF